jgi:hypothetical protein
MRNRDITEVTGQWWVQSDDAATFLTNTPRNDIYMTLIPGVRFSGTIGFPDTLDKFC